MQKKPLIALILGVALLLGLALFALLTTGQPASLLPPRDLPASASNWDDDAPLAADIVSRADGSLDGASAPRVEVGFGPRKSAQDAETGRLHGLVVAKENGQPIPGVQVTLFRTISRFQARTDSEGYFRFSDLPPKRFRVSFLIPGRVPAVFDDVEIRPNELRRYDAILDRGRDLTVFVRGGGGKKLPVPYASIQAIQGRIRDFPIMGMTKNLDLGTHQSVTDQDGKALIQGLDSHPYQLFVSAPGFVNWIEEIRLDGDKTLQIALLEGATIEGLALRPGGSPLRGGWAFLAPDKRLGAAREYFYREDAVRVREDGSFRIGSIPPGVHYLAVVSEDGGLGQAEGPLELSPGQSASVRVTVPEPAVLTGKVLDPSGKPVPHAKVYLSHKDLRMQEMEFFPYWIDGRLNDAIRRSARSDADGLYRLEGTRAGKEVTLRARAEGFRLYEAQFFLPAGQTVAYDIPMVPEDAVIAGLVTDSEGKPFPGVKVEGKVGGRKSDFDAFEAQTGEDGMFRLAVPRDSPPLTVYVKVVRDAEPWYEIFPEEIPSVLPGAENLGFVIRKAPFVRGEVFSEDGDPVTDFEYSLFDKQRGRFAESYAVHDRWGQFAAPYTPEADARLRVAALGFEPITVTDLDRFLRIVLTRGVRIEGRVVRKNGSPISGALVGVSTLPGDFYPQGCESAPRAIAGSDGSFAISALPKDFRGFLVICPNREDLPPLVKKPFDARSAPQGPLEIEVPEGSLVEISLVRPGGEPGLGRAIVVSAEGWPVDPWIEPSLQALRNPTSPDYYRRGKGLFRARLEPGSYKLIYRISRPKEEIKTFSFDVKDGASNRFAFSVER